MNNTFTISIVTPSYNRAHLLPRCFASLSRQTDHDFEWILVDDGSTDHTEAVVRNFRTDDFPITYVKKPNGGKHTALNTSHAYLHGKYVLLLDSDDYLTEDAVAQVKAAWSKWERHTEVGILTFLKGDSSKRPNCIVSDWDMPVDIMRCRRICQHSSDCCEVIRTELFRKYPFPVFAGERFLAEGVLWNRVSFESKCVYINSVIYICEYLEDGLTKAGRAMRICNPHGGMYNANIQMDKKNVMKLRIKNGLLYTCYGCFAGLRPHEMAEKCRAKALMWTCLPFGWMLYLYWKRKYGGE